MPKRARRPELMPAEAIAHRVPLAPPAGMRDLLPPASLARLRLRQKVVESFQRFGYDLVVTPAFELAEVIEGGIHSVDRRELLRFVEPDTGEVALLRPDITPQIARIIATGLRDRPPPFRLCYEGSIFRRRRGRARKQLQISQAGVECVGMPGPDADVEVIELAIRACEAVGLERFHVELAQVGLGTAALAAVPEEARRVVVESLARKDATALEAQLRAADVPASERRSLLALIELYGGPEVVVEARRALKEPAMQQALDALERVLDRLGAAGLSHRLGVDLGELRGQAYYTGTSFTVLADGPGEPLGAGGRYDNLLSAFDAPSPATGFALDVDNLDWALRAAGAVDEAARPLRAVFVEPLEGRADAGDAIARLRAMGQQVARLPHRGASEAAAFAAAWGYDVVIEGSKSRLEALRLRDHERRSFDLASDEAYRELDRWARSNDAIPTQANEDE
jgi:ATP phosphoribosyltransferase regulatory subunit